MLTIKERTQPLTEVKANNKCSYKKKLTAEHGDGVFFSQHSPPPPTPPPPRHFSCTVSLSPKEESHGRKPLVTVHITSNSPSVLNAKTIIVWKENLHVAVYQH